MRDWQIVTLFLSGLLVVMALTAWGALTFARANCFERFEGSNLPVKWSVVGKCRVKVPEHGWIPAENYRVL